MPLELDNRTPFSCAHPPMLAKNGANILRFVVRATFDIGADGTLTLAAKQAPVRLEDVYWGEKGKSSLRYEMDLSLEKPFTDLIINGHAQAPGAQPATAVSVGLMVEERLVKQMRVFGDRRWDYGIAGWSITTPKPFVTMPVIYDRAFGGMDEAGSEARNRVGTGYASQVDDDFIGTPLPNVEYVDTLIQSPKDRPRPAGLGIVSRDWQQRVRFAGTYDQQWLDERMPLLPDDFDVRFNQSAPEEQWLRSAPEGQKVRVLGMTPEGSLGFRVPRGAMSLRLYYKKRRVETDMPLDCVLVDCDLKQVELTWRASADVHGDPFQLQKMVVSTDSPELLPPATPALAEPPSEAS